MGLAVYLAHKTNAIPRIFSLIENSVSIRARVSFY